MTYLFYKQSVFANRNSIFCKLTKKNQLILNELLPIDYKPPFYLPHPLIQLVCHIMKKKNPDIFFKREYLLTSDNGILTLDWLIDSKTEKSKDFDKIIFLLHGMTGGSETGYMKEIIEGFKDSPHNKVVTMHMRGINDTLLFTPTTYHAASIDDVIFSLESVKKRYPDKICYLVGVSMGANILTNLVSTTNLDGYIKGFVSISNPCDLFCVEQQIRGSIIERFIMFLFRFYVTNHRYTLYNLNKGNTIQ